jgi:hypothetical protein
MMSSKIKPGIKHIIIGVLIIFFVLFGCGKKGPPLPPIITIPNKVIDLSTVQVGERVRLSFTLPEKNTNETKPAEIAKIIILRKIEGYDNEPKEIERIDRENINKHIINNKVILYDNSISKLGIKEKIISYFVLVNSNKNRNAGLSNEGTLKILNPLKAPSGVKYEVRENGIKIEWDKLKEDDGAVKYQICKSYDREILEAYNCIDVPINNKEYIDLQIEESKHVFYYVKAIDEKKKMESEPSEIIEVEYKDMFPPPVPEGLVFITDEEGIILNWKPVISSDLGGYRIYKRKRGEAEFKLISEVAPNVTTYKDNNVSNGNVYEYYITSIDKSDLVNESKASNIIIVEYNNL